MTPEPLPEVEFTPHGIWVTLAAAFVGFWLLFAVNAFFVGLFTDISVPILAGLAAVGQSILFIMVSAEQMLGVLILRAGITVKTKKKNTASA